MIGSKTYISIGSIIDLYLETDYCLLTVLSRFYDKILNKIIKEMDFDT